MVCYYLLIMWQENQNGHNYSGESDTHSQHHSPPPPHPRTAVDTQEQA